MAAERGKRKINVGIVISNKMDKTAVVRVERVALQPMYKKYIKKRTNIKIHDAENVCKVGDKVMISETRPLSKEKRWRLREVIQKAV